jgi:hypothetical protein
MSNQVSHQETRVPAVQEPNTPFPLMELPIELRTKVYRELLLAQHPLRMVGFDAIANGLRPEILQICWQVYNDNAIANGLRPEILQTCRRVYNEAIEVLYGENEFQISEQPERLPLEACEG